MRTWPRSFDSLIFDYTLVALFLVGAEVELVIDSRRTNPLVFDALALGVLMLALLRRRQNPVTVTLVAAVAASLLAVHGDIRHLSLPMVVLFVTPYSVARYATWGRATAGLAIALSVPLVLVLTSVTHSGLVFNVGAITTSWAVGRTVRGSHVQAEALRRRKARAEGEREDRQRHALVSERTRIALELQAVVIDSVSDMVLQAETADRLLAVAPTCADHAMASVESVAHQVLDDMRRVLGILRDPDASFDLTPLPGIGDLGPMRGTDGRAVELAIHGSPDSVPASLGLALYRLLRSALDAATERPAYHPLVASIRFAASSVQVELSVAGTLCVGWPTVAMREWVALCDGQLGTASSPTAGEWLTVTIPQPSEVYA